jgi:primosomal protein N' (replication factor Y) (superfamily II helicase)
MLLLEVLIEHATHHLNRTFSYYYQGKKKVERGYRVLVNFNNQLLVGYVVKASYKQESLTALQANTPYKINSILDVIDEFPLLNEELMTLAEQLSQHYFWPHISVLQAMLPKSLKPKKTALKGPKIAYETYLIVIDNSEDGLTAKQSEWLRAIAKESSFPKRDMNAPSILKQLIEKGKVKQIQKEKLRLKQPNYIPEKPNKLTNDQQNVINEINNSNDDIYLLEGVTGSGKTEIYLALSETILKHNKSVLIIVPEIALTPMMVAYFIKRFGKDVAILHSELTPAEKYDEYRRIASGKCHIVVGARSAVFAPLDNIGLIVLDEEHVESYKQDVMPFYHARDVAFMRGKSHRAKVILGSATPSLESKARARKGVYHQLYLKKRINEKELPKAHIVDMLNPKNVTRESSLFSLKMMQGIERALSRQEQVVLLINRRGYAPFISCRKCGHTFKCPTCNIALTYHRQDQMLKCHHCDYAINYPEHCDKCHSTHLIRQGFGTERIVDEMNRLFPQARLLRLDSDTSKVRQSIIKIIEQFKDHKADVLIGTQMIAKGHDFPKVTLVGMILADIGLTMPSYRSSERTFQLITQAVGRSGRGNEIGTAIIQTYAPHHYAVIEGSNQDYQAFYLKEMRQRKLSQYPPYTYLASLLISGKNEQLVIESISSLANLLSKHLKENATIIGPSSPYISFLGGRYRRQLILKYKNYQAIRPALEQALILLGSKSTIRLTINIDPYDI